VFDAGLVVGVSPCEPLLQVLAGCRCRPAVGGGSAGIRADRLLTADEDELSADALGAHRKLVGRRGP
jgi:hypothetical protein